MSSPARPRRVRAAGRAPAQATARARPRRDDVRFKVLATAVTSRDCLIRSLELPAAIRMAARLAVGMATLRRLLLGLVLAGEIDTVGKDLSRFTEGDQVFGFDCFCLRLLCRLQVHGGNRRPVRLSYEQAAAMRAGAATGVLAAVASRRRSRRGRPSAASGGRPDDVGPRPHDAAPRSRRPSRCGCGRGAPASRKPGP